VLAGLREMAAGLEQPLITLEHNKIQHTIVIEVQACRKRQRRCFFEADGFTTMADL
jgi:hypothetical protein